ncbi:MAG: DUF2490 domain-containing protein [Chitinophagales bacterium]
MIKKFCWIAFWCFPVSALAQDQDLATWLQAGIEIDLPKKFTLDISEEQRYNIETSDAYALYSNISLEYKWNKHLFTGAEYRYKTPGAYNAPAHRVATSITYRNSFNDFNWNVRTKLQYDIKPDNFETSAWRNKIGLKYDGWKDIKPYVSYEVFYALLFSGNTFNTIRPEFGVNFQLSKQHEITAYYLIDKNFNEYDPLTLYVLGLNYLFKFAI